MPRRPKCVFTASNRHNPSCGDPPDIRTGPDLYYGYFETDLGEQWVLVIDKKAMAGRLQGGDCGWGKVYEVTVAPNGLVRGLPVLRPAEADWVRACLRAAGLG